LNVDESEPSKIDLICFSPTILEFTGLTFLIINFGSGLPDPKGDRTLILS